MSNFIIHLSILNDAVLTLLLSNSNYDKSNKSEIRKQIILQIDELAEDQNAYLSFKLGFLFLKAMNLAFRMEKNKPELGNHGNNIGIFLDNLKYPQLDCSKVDISGFCYNSNDVEDFCKKEGITNYKNEHYVLKKLRNALMHGNIRFKMDCNQGAVFVFDDKYHDRINTIEIAEKLFAKFLEQEELYKNISSNGIMYPMSD